MARLNNVIKFDEETDERRANSRVRLSIERLAQEAERFRDASRQAVFLRGECTADALKIVLRELREEMEGRL